MSPGIATALYALGILGLFVLNRDRKARTSAALWVPVVWFLIIASRSASVWLAGRSQWPPQESPGALLEGNLLDEVLFAVLFTVGLIVLASRRRRVGALLSRNGPILLFYLYCAMSIMWSDYTFVAFKRWIKFVADLVMVLIVLTDGDPPAAVTRFLTRTGFLLVPASVLLIKYYQDLGRLYNRWTWTPQWVGVTTSKNELGMLCVIFGLASVWCFLQEIRGGKGRRRVGPLIAHGTVLLMVLWLFAKIDSMTALAIFVLAGGLMAVARTALARRPAALHFLVATILSASLAAVFLDAGGLLRDLGRDPTLTGRTDIWHQVLGMTSNPLLGTGFESFWLGDRLAKMWSIYWWHPNEAHNGYIEIFLNLGWIGIALLAVVLVAGYRNAFGAFCRDPRTGSLKLALVVAAVINNFTEATFKGPSPLWIIFLLAATAVAEAPVGARASLPHGVRVRPDQRRADLPAARMHAYKGIV
jgi:exopolysaccharide production protein ExoQ